MLEMVLYTYTDKDCNKNVVIQVSEDEVIIYNTYKENVISFDYNVDMYEYMCENIDFENEVIYVNKDFRDTHFENVKFLLKDLDKDTIYHLLKDIEYE